MTILYYDCFSGICGDMHLGAMIDAGVDPDFLVNELNKLNLSGYSIEIKRDKRKGIEGTKADVVLEDKHQPHRHLKDIADIINNSSLDDVIKKKSLFMFQKIAEAEAKVHGTTVDQIHFHEVGAVDAIVDIVGAAICINYLNPDKIMASPVELGGGFVNIAHGKIPVPAPATVEILKGLPVTTGAVPFETTTPTGATILASNVDEFSDNPKFIITKTAYGIGNRDTEIPNVLRVYLAESTEEKSLYQYSSYMIECNIDDMNPEYYGFLMEKLFTIGAEDVFFSSVIMKKSRPATILSVLCKENAVDEITECLITETSSFGFRKYKVDKLMLDREMETISTKYGEITIKKGFFKGRQVKVKPEYEDCKRIAEEQKLPLTKVYAEVEKIISDLKIN
ncbi:MAG: nickel pincer cofactor biosynthesis protein LarC [Bacteroidales bacterium]|nr:nickel pincer cofactor biosynthesis protein LarC [Bacteroidales bacterium]